MTMPSDLNELSTAIEPMVLYEYVAYFLVKEYGQVLGVHGEFAGPDESLWNFTSSSSKLVMMGVPPRSIVPTFGWGALEFQCMRTAAHPRCECGSSSCGAEQHGYGWAMAHAGGRNSSIKATGSGFDRAIGSAWVSYIDIASNEVRVLNGNTMIFALKRDGFCTSNMMSYALYRGRQRTTKIQSL